MEITDELAFNIVSDWKKKKVHPHDKALFLQSYLKKKGCSQRQLAKDLDISHSTLQDWISINRLDKDEYDGLIELGSTPTDIYRVARSKRKESLDGITQLDVLLSRLLFVINKTERFSNLTVRRAKEVMKELEKIIK